MIPYVYQCYVCQRQLGKAVPSVIRIFAGRHGGGFAACDQHANIAIDAGLASMMRKHPIHVPDSYRVVAYSVVPDPHLTGSLKQGRMLWSAKRKAA